MIALMGASSSNYVSAPDDPPVGSDCWACRTLPPGTSGTEFCEGEQVEVHMTSCSSCGYFKYYDLSDQIVDMFLVDSYPCPYCAAASSWIDQITIGSNGSWYATPIPNPGTVYHTVQTTTIPFWVYCYILYPFDE